MKGLSLTQLYWPSSFKEKEGYLVGWSIRGFVCCVIGVLDIPLESLELVLAEKGDKAQVLGIVKNPSSKETLEEINKKATADIWFTALIKDKVLWLQEVHCCGYRYRANAQLIFYNNYPQKTDPTYLIAPPSFERFFVQNHNSESSTFQLVCDHINKAQFAYENILSKKDSSKESRNLLVKALGVFLCITKVLWKILLYLYCWELPLLNKSVSNLPLNSKLLEQISIRCRALDKWELTKNCQKPSKAYPSLVKVYINDFLVSRGVLVQYFIDLFLGLSLLTFLHFFGSDTLSVIHTLGSTIHIEVLKSEVSWLMGLPAGFKPNEELDNTIGINILALIDYWNTVTTFLTRMEPQILQVVSYVGMFGLSYQIAFLSDLIDFCTLHM